MNISRFIILVLVTPIYSHAGDLYSEVSKTCNASCMAARAYVQGNNPHSYEPQINSVYFPSRDPMVGPADIISRPGAPLILDTRYGDSLNFGKVNGPWEVRSPVIVDAQFISEWPYVASTPFILNVFGPTPQGLPIVSPGISCTKFLYPSGGTQIRCVN